MSLSIQSQNLSRESQRTNPPIPQKIINHQKYEIEVFQTLEGRLTCDFNDAGVHHFAVPIINASGYFYKGSIGPFDLTYYPPLKTFVLGGYGLKGGMKKTSTSLVYDPQKSHQLLQEKFENPSKGLSTEERLLTLFECMKLGEFRCAQGIGEDLVIVLGGTGTGKSTLINYLYGCDMEMIKYKSAIKGKAIVVKPKILGGRYDPIMEIGHKGSMTFIPQVLKDPQGKKTYCDCPGFSDTRGSEINIANVVNIKKMLTQAKSVKLIILINYHGLSHPRAPGLAQLVQYITELFGTKETVVKFQNSILVGLTHIDRSVSSEDQRSLNQLKVWMTKNDGRLSFDQTVLNCLANQLFIYDPLNSSQLLYREVLSREALLEKIESLSPINNPIILFQTPLTPTDQGYLFKLVEMIKVRIQHDCRNQNFQQAAQFLQFLEQLQVIEHQKVVQLFVDLKFLIINQFKEMIHQFDIYCGQDSSEAFRNGQQVLKELNRGLEYFSEDIQKEVQNFLQNGLITETRSLDNQAMTHWSLQKENVEHKIYKLLSIKNLEAEQLEKKLAQNHQQFLKQSAQLSQSLQNCIHQFEQEIHSRTLSVERFTHIQTVIDISQTTLDLIRQTAEQYLELQKTSHTLGLEQFSGAMNLLFHARELEIQYIIERLSLLGQHHHHQFTLSLQIHSQKMKEESEQFDKLLRLRRSKHEETRRGYKNDIDLLQQENLHTKDCHQLEQEKKPVYLQYQEEMYRLQSNLTYEKHRIDVETRQRIAEVLSHR